MVEPANAVGQEKPWQTPYMEIIVSQLKMEGLVAIAYASMEAKHLQISEGLWTTCNFGKIFNKHSS